ncbi:hypothetical protein Tco_0732038 [Tanacetum coccineum]
MNQNFNYSNSFGFDQIQPPQQFDNHQPQEIPEIIPFFDSETKNELYKMMEDFTERMNQELRKQEALLAAQREQELLVQKQAAQEKQVPSPNSVFRQLIDETCGMNVCEEQKQNMEDTMLELLKDCRQKELYCIHNNVDDLFESALNSKLLSINLNSQHLDKKKQKVKNIAEPTAKRQTRITPCLKNFKVNHKESIIPLNKTPQISLVNDITPDLLTVEPDNSLSMGDKHLSTILETESDEVIKSSVENLVPIPSESEGISDDTCDVPVCDDFSTFDALKDHSKILSDSNDDGTSSDDDDFEDIEYVDASPPDSELISLEEKLLNINRLIVNIESLNDNPTHDRVLESPSSFPIPVKDNDSFFEKSDTSYSDNSLPKFDTFSDHTEETSSGSTTTHANNSLPEYDSFHFEIEPDQGGLTSVVMEDILGEPRVHVPNVLPTHPTLMMDLDVIIRTFFLISPTLWILLYFSPPGVKTPFLTPASPLRAGGISSGWNFHDAWVEETIINEDEVIPEDETPELITELQDIDKRVPTIFDYERMRATLNDALSNQFKNAKEYAYHLEQTMNFMENQIVWESRQEDIRRPVAKPLVFFGPQQNPNEPPRITEVVRITTDQPHGLDFMEQIIMMRENDKPDSFSEADFKYLNKNDNEDLYYLCRNKKLGIESYQIKVNLTAPTLMFSSIEAHEPYFIVDKPSTGTDIANITRKEPKMDKAGYENG